jgi:tetratricopeptide (TPR) repeat protein
MHSYSARDVERVLSLSRSTLRSLISVGFVKPARGPKREYRFSFQDLIVLRAARSLIEANIPRTRIRRSLQSLRQHLPATLPLSGLSICAVGEQVVVREGQNHWHSETGQYLLGLDISLKDGVLRVIEHRSSPADSKSAVEWFAEGLQLEASDPQAALRAYERSLCADPDNVAAWMNRGRLLHELGKKHEAERVYGEGLRQCPGEPLLLFNLAVLLEDLGRTAAALESYQCAVTQDPTLADAHYNLARLYESLGLAQHAIRHLGEYRRLVTHDERQPPA